MGRAHLCGPGHTSGLLFPKLKHKKPRTSAKVREEVVGKEEGGGDGSKSKV